MRCEPYQIAQKAIAELKTAVYSILKEAGSSGLKNVQVGKALGIYTGHVRHEGHISRTILAIMEAEGVVRQDKETLKWYYIEIQEEAECVNEVVK